MTFKTFGILGAALVLSACGVSKPRPAPAPPTVAPAPALPPAGAAVYRIDSQQSEIRLLVYKAGAIARLGHNHVIVNRAVSGWVNAPGSASLGSFSLTIPAAGFIVDESDARAAEGSDFAQDVGEEAKSGTLHNMLSAALLDADRYPDVTVSSITLAPSQSALEATVAVTIAGHESRLKVPFAMESSAGAISASGSAVLRQSELGLVPFSVMAGALKVQDEMTIKFRFIARKG